MHLYVHLSGYSGSHHMFWLNLDLEKHYGICHSHSFPYLVGIFRTQFCLFHRHIRNCNCMYTHSYLFNVDVRSILKISLAGKTMSHIQKM